jgi:hypothetical protein
MITLLMRVMTLLMSVWKKRENDVDPEVENVPYWKEAKEERILRFDISRMILNGVSVELIKKCTRITIL